MIFPVAACLTSFIAGAYLHFRIGDDPSVKQVMTRIHQGEIWIREAITITRPLTAQARAKRIKKLKQQLEELKEPPF